MAPRPFILATCMVLALVAPASADDTGAFVFKLGQDTTSVEQYTRTPGRLEVHQVGRAPRTLERRYVYDYGKDGVITAFSMVVTPPMTLEPNPTQTVSATFKDSARTVSQTGTSPAQTAVAPFPKGTIAVTNSSPWVSYETLTMKLASGKADSLRTTMYLVGGQTYWLSLRKLGRDSISVINERGDQYHVKVDRAGMILGVLPVAGTQKFSVERVAKVDVDAIAASWLAREKAGAGMGTLSPRDSVVTNVAGASLWIDYGRPGKRGREVFGGIVPYGEVWRTGANAATQIRTDKALDFGGTVVPAGFYTLWTIPSPTGWKLIVNSETGQWGTAHKAEKDLFTVDMKLSALSQVVERFTISVDPAPEGGVLHLDWDTTRASAAFTVRP
ncbi:MAG TPA: DUF2911 domain-containing protein [Candidatus Eisenbacteria bacterium]|nr:DUF2911 domain-containing protein [Candidatus Eisenbacteria bacterium]